MESPATDGSLKAAKRLPAGHLRADVALRAAVFALSAVALGCLLSSNQTKMVLSPFLPFPVRIEAKFSDSSAFIYLVVTSSVVVVYTAASAVSVLRLSRDHPSFLLLVLTFSDAVMAAIMGSGAAAASSMGYIALKGNDRVQVKRICNVFDRFCIQMGTSLVLSLMATVLLLVLVFSSAFSLYRRGR